jgi:hypothetical protein
MLNEIGKALSGIQARMDQILSGQGDHWTHSWGQASKKIKNSSILVL